MFHKIIKIEALDNFELMAQFDNGELKIYDVSALINEHDQFKSLRNVNGLFKLVKIEADGYGVSWNDELDLDSEEIWCAGHPI